MLIKTLLLFPCPGGNNPGLPRRFWRAGLWHVVLRRLRRVQLVVDGVRHPCPLLGFPHQRDRSAGLGGPCARFSVALPPGIVVPLPSWQTSGLLSRAQRETVEPQPSRGEYNSFLSPAQAAGAPTFCDATESRQRSQPRGLSPPWPSPAFSASPPENVRPCAHPLEAMQNPGWSTQRHPRATALICTVRFIASVATGTIGRRRFLRGVAVPACLNSVSTGSIRRTAAPVRTVFSCVASRKREEPLSPGTKPPGPRRAPTLSGRINLFPLPRSSRGGSYFL